MKRTALLFIIVASVISYTAASPVDINTARNVAIAHIAHAKHLDSAEPKLSLAVDPARLSAAMRTTTAEIVPYYIYNVEGGGYVIVAADDRVTPIIGYSLTGSFHPDSIPSNMRGWLNGIGAEISSALAADISSSIQTDTAWQTAISKTRSTTSSKTAIAPLIQTKWDQTEGYNDLCPYDSRYNERTITGCVATAMAQVMKYHNHPARGFGHHTYIQQPYDSISASFGSTVYDWANMPNKLSASSTDAQIEAVATLMYHCGVSIETGYNTISMGGSGAFTTLPGYPQYATAEKALRNYFSYSPSLSGVYKEDYTDSEWTDLLYNELAANRPVIYSGDDGTYGHCFVLDGYDTNGMFHFNWGWSGAYDGYFALSALNPGTGGAGSGSGVYSYAQEAIINIQPANSSPSAAIHDSISMAADLTPTALSYSWDDVDDIYFESVVKNSGADTFRGRFFVEIIDNNGTTVAYTDTTVTGTFPAGTALKTYPKAPSSLLPGSYTARLHAINALDSSWIVEDNLGANYAEFAITTTNTSDIEMFSEFSIDSSSSNVLTRNAVSNIAVSFINNGYYDFSGYIIIGLFNAADKSIAQQLDSFYETHLPSEYGYFPYETTVTVTTAPGKYLLGIATKTTATSDYSFIGTDYFKNPLLVKVKDPILTAVDDATSVYISVTPNPATDFAHIAVEHPIRKITIVDAQGRTVYHNTLSGDKVTETVAVDRFAPGIYFIYVSTDQNTCTQKLIIK